MKIKTQTLRGMRKCFLGSLVLFVALTPFLSYTQTSTAAPVRRIRFKPGQTSASVKGRLNGMNDERLFVLRARKGQHMRVEIIGKGATRGWVIAPSGEEDGQPGGVIFDDQLKETGDYKIRVTESQMADAWKGTFILKVSITG
jgi:hypothetical protein